MSRSVSLNSSYIMLFDLNSPVTYQNWVMAATMDPLGIQERMKYIFLLILTCNPSIYNGPS